MGEKPNIFAPPETTALSSFKPWTEAERKKFYEESHKFRLNNALEEVVVHAYFNNEFAEKLCEKVSLLSQGNRKLVDIIKKHAVVTQGRHAPLPSAWNLLLAHRYAYLMTTIEIDDYKKREEVVFKDLIEYQKEMLGTEITYESMETRITKAIKAEKDNDALSWAKNFFDERAKRSRRQAK